MRWTWVITVSLFFAPALALGCAVCGTGPERSRAAYISMTALLSLLPLTMLGALVWLFVRRLRRLEPKEGPPPREVVSEPSGP
jgi:hypothetical protein